LHSQSSDDLRTLARRVVSADADEIFFMLASVDASFVAAQTAIALESRCGERRYRETRMALAHVNASRRCDGTHAGLGKSNIWLTPHAGTSGSALLNFDWREGLRRDGRVLPLGDRALDILTYLARPPR